MTTPLKIEARGKRQEKRPSLGCLLASCFWFLASYEKRAFSSVNGEL
jgi:hypothetical protein